MSSVKKRRRSNGIALEQKSKDLLVRAKKIGPQAACFFNNKGGVGKTTLVANLAAEFSINYGAKILVVDCDPQCNLTQYSLGTEKAIEIYSHDDPKTIYSIMRPLSLGKGYEAELPINSIENFGYDLIYGDPRLALQEDLLANDWRDAKAGGMRGIQTTFVFSDLVKKAKAKGYDFIFFDMGPSLGAINRSVLLAMDYFVVPMAIDIFSVWAIKNIGNTVKVWQRELSTGIKLAEDPREFSDVGAVNRLKFLGYVTQQHKERGLNDTAESSTETPSRKIVEAYRKISSGIPDEVRKHLSSFYNAEKINPHLGDIKHLGSLAPKSQSLHLPMISVNATGSYTTLRKQAREIYRTIADKFLENINQDQS